MIVNIINFFIRKWLRNVSVASTKDFHPYEKFVQSKNKEDFNEIYKRGLVVTQTPESLWRKDRFLNLFNLAKGSIPFDGVIAECGCWKGLSAYVIASAVQSQDLNFKGENFFVIDSFEGLSKPDKLDGQMNISTDNKFFSDIEMTKKNLNEFSNITYIKGWIPNVLSEIPEKKYSFVHIDVDLATPTIEAMKYFFPRLTPAGLIVCDDYGSIHWHGMRKEVDSFCKNEGIKNIMLSTGQLILFKS